MIKRLINKWIQRNLSAINAEQSQSVSEAFGIGADTATNLTPARQANYAVLMQQYRKSPSLYRSVKILSEVVSTVGIQYERVSGSGEPQDNHQRIDDVLSNNNIGTYIKLLQKTLKQRILTGNAYWIKVREGNRVVGIISLPPDKVQPRQNGDYEVNMPNGVMTTFMNEDIIDFKDIAPDDTLRGVSPLEALYDVLLIEQNALKHEVAAFDNQGHPDTIIFKKNPVGDFRGSLGGDFVRGQQYGLTGGSVESGKANNYTKSTNDKVKKSAWDEEYRGVQNARKTMLSKEELGVVRVQPNAKEMDYHETLKEVEKKIGIILGIPVGILHSEKVSKADGLNAYAILKHITLIPFLIEIYETINVNLVAELDPSVVIVPNEPLYEMEDIQETPEAAELISRAYRLMRHKLTQTVIQSNPYSSIHKDVEQKYIEQSLEMRKLQDREENYYMGLVDRQREQAGNRMKRKLSTVYATFGDNIQKYINEFSIDDFRGMSRADLIDEITKTLIVDNATLERFDDIILQQSLKLADDAGRLVIADATNELVDVDDFVRTQLVVDNVRGIVEGSGISVYNTLNKQVATVIADGYARDLSKVQILDRVEGMVSQTRDWRLERVVQTATTEAHAIGAETAIMQSDIMTHKQWLTVQDENVRPNHQIHGQTVPKTEQFSNGLMRPEGFNCRCTVRGRVVKK